MSGDAARRLLLLRHAKAVALASPMSEAGDHARDLAERGRQDAARLGDTLRNRVLLPELGLVSSARRTRRTWELLGPLGSSEPDLVVSDRLYLAEAEELLFVLREVPDQVRSVMLVGHNPGLHQLSLHLARGDGDVGPLAGGMPTCTLAMFEVDGDWADLRPHSARALQLIRP